MSVVNNLQVFGGLTIGDTPNDVTLLAGTSAMARTYTILDAGETGYVATLTNCTLGVSTHVYTTRSTIVIPSGVSRLSAKLWGSGGSAMNYQFTKGGAGGYSYWEDKVEPGDVFELIVGGPKTWQTSSGASGRMSVLFKKNGNQYIVKAIGGGGGGGGLDGGYNYYNNGCGADQGNATSYNLYGISGHNGIGGNKSMLNRVNGNPGSDVPNLYTNDLTQFDSTPTAFGGVGGFGDDTAPGYGSGNGGDGYGGGCAGTAVYFGGGGGGGNYSANGTTLPGIFEIPGNATDADKLALLPTAGVPTTYVNILNPNTGGCILYFTTDCKTQLKVPNDTASDNVSAGDFKILGSSKTNGTGNGGDLVLVGGSSAGGAAGNVKINTNLIPDSDITRSLGTIDKRWSNIFADNGSVNALSIGTSTNEVTLLAGTSVAARTYTIIDAGETGYVATLTNTPSLQLKVPDDATLNVNPAYDFTIKGVNKTLGSGTGGNLILTGGDSSSNGGDLILSGGNTDAPGRNSFIGAAGQIRINSNLIPHVDNLFHLGSIDNRLSNIFSVTGSLNTSLTLGQSPNDVTLVPGTSSASRSYTILDAGTTGYIPILSKLDPQYLISSYVERTTIIVPTDIAKMQVKLWGCGGHGRSDQATASGAGGYSYWEGNVSAGDIYELIVGKQRNYPTGWGVGGGMSILFKNNGDSYTALAIAGGGGGSGVQTWGRAQAGGQMTNDWYDDNRSGSNGIGGAWTYNSSGSSIINLTIPNLSEFNPVPGPTLFGGNGGIGYANDSSSGGNGYGGGSSGGGSTSGSGGGGGGNYSANGSTQAGYYATPGNASDPDKLALLPTAGLPSYYIDAQNSTSYNGGIIVYLQLDDVIQLKVPDDNTINKCPNLLISGVNKTSTGDGGDLILMGGSSVDGAAGKISVKSNLIPFTDIDKSLGSIDKRWSNLYTSNAYVNNLYSPTAAYNILLDDTSIILKNSGATTTIKLDTDIFLIKSGLLRGHIDSTHTQLLSPDIESNLTLTNTELSVSKSTVNRLLIDATKSQLLSPNGNYAIEVNDTGCLINKSTNSYTLPTTRGTAGQVLTSNGTSQAMWASTAMPVVTNDLNMNSYKITSLMNGVDIGDAVNLGQLTAYNPFNQVLNTTSDVQFKSLTNSGATTSIKFDTDITLRQNSLIRLNITSNDTTIAAPTITNYMYLGNAVMNAVFNSVSRLSINSVNTSLIGPSLASLSLNNTSAIVSISGGYSYTCSTSSYRVSDSSSVTRVLVDATNTSTYSPNFLSNIVISNTDISIFRANSPRTHIDTFHTQLVSPNVTQAFEVNDTGCLVNLGTASYTLPTTRGTAGQVITSNGTSPSTWSNVVTTVTNVGTGTTLLSSPDSTKGLVVGSNLTISNTTTDITVSTSATPTYTTVNANVDSAGALTIGASTAISTTIGKLGATTNIQGNIQIAGSEGSLGQVLTSNGTTAAWANPGPSYNAGFSLFSPLESTGTIGSGSKAYWYNVMVPCNTVLTGFKTYLTTGADPFHVAIYRGKTPNSTLTILDLLAPIVTVAGGGYYSAAFVVQAGRSNVYTAGEYITVMYHSQGSSNSFYNFIGASDTNLAYTTSANYGNSTPPANLGSTPVLGTIANRLAIEFY